MFDNCLSGLRLGSMFGFCIQKSAPVCRGRDEAAGCINTLDVNRSAWCLASKLPELMSAFPWVALVIHSYILLKLPICRVLCTKPPSATLFFHPLSLDRSLISQHSYLLHKMADYTGGELEADHLVVLVHGVCSSMIMGRHWFLPCSRPAPEKNGLYSI